MRWNLGVAALASSWGFISVIVAGVELSALVLVFWRVAIATAAIAIVLAGYRRLALVWPPRAGVLLVGSLLAAHWFLFFETIKLSSVAVALLTVYTSPIFLALLAPLVLPETRSRIALVALAPAGAGLALIALAGGDSAHPRPLAIVTGLAAAFTYALLVISTKWLTGALEPITITFWVNLVSAALLAPFLVLGGRLVPHGAEIGYVLLVGAVFTALSGFVYISLLRHVTAQAIGILSYLEVVSSALLAWAILEQSLGWAVVAGGALVIAGGVLVVLYEPAEAPPVLRNGYPPSAAPTLRTRRHGGASV